MLAIALAIPIAVYGKLLAMTTPTKTERAKLVAQVAELRPDLRKRLAGRIIVVAAYKGGAGKSTVAREWAWLTGANLVDFEHDNGAVSRAMGYQHENYMSAPLVDAMLSGRTPRLTYRPNCPPFVPGHPDWESNQPSEGVITSTLERWATELDGEAPLVVDTHPGGTAATRAALAAAHLVVTPIELTELALTAAEGMLSGDLKGHNVLIVPNKVKLNPLDRHISRLERAAKSSGAEIATEISRYQWLDERTLNRPLASADPMPARNVPVVRELIAGVQEGADLVTG